MSVETLPRPSTNNEPVNEPDTVKPEIGETLAQFQARQNGQDQGDASIAAVTDTPVEASSKSALDYGKMEQITYSTGAKHVYGVDKAGKKRHLSQDGVLESYGYSADEVKEARKEDEAQAVKDAALVASEAAKATPSMVKTAKILAAAKNKESNTIPPEEKAADEPASIGEIYKAGAEDYAAGYKSFKTRQNYKAGAQGYAEGFENWKQPKEISDADENLSTEELNHKIDELKQPIKRSLEAKDYEGYTMLMGKADEYFNQLAGKLSLSAEEKQRAQDAFNEEVIPPAKKAENNPAKNPEDAPAADSADTDDADSLKKTSNNKFKLLRRATNSIMLAPTHVLRRIGEMMNRAEADKDKEKRGRRVLLIGATAMVGGGLVWANNKYNWGIDINPLDGDGLDLNPFNNTTEQADRVAGGVPVPFEGSEAVSPEMVTVNVGPNEGTSHIARNVLGIDFNNVEDWNRFNDATNHLFEGLDGTYVMPDGKIGIAHTGGLQVPRSVLDESLRVAEQIRANS